MRRSTAAIGSAAWFVVVPGTFAVLIPRLITGWELHRPLPHWLVAEPDPRRDTLRRALKRGHLLQPSHRRTAR